MVECRIRSACERHCDGGALLGFIGYFMRLGWVCRY